MEIKNVNTKCLSINTEFINLTKLLRDVENINKYKKYMTTEELNKNIAYISDTIGLLSINNLKIDYSLNLDILITKLKELINNLGKQANYSIQNISLLIKIRDLLLMSTFALLLIMILTESISYYKLSNEISYCLKRIELKDYDFNIKKSSLPYSEDILDKIDSLRLNLKTIDGAISGTLKGYGIKETLEEIYCNENFKRYINFDRIGFAEIQDGRIIASFSFSNTKDLYLKQGYNLLLQDSSLLKLSKDKEIRIIDDLEKYLSNNTDSQSTKLLINDGYKSSLTAPVFDSKGIVVGFLFFTSRNKNQFVDNDKYKVISISEILSSIFSKNMLIDDLITNTALGFVKLVEDKDPETGNHLEKMQIYSKIIATDLLNRNIYPDELDINKVQDIYKYSPLHDIGKVGIPDKVLLKPDKLTNDEMDIMKNHSLIGSRVLVSFEDNLKKYEHDFFKTAINISLSHHENWDGSGYPKGLKGLNIPIEARIVRVADVFDALVSKRVYKKAFTFDESVNIILSASGTDFDPNIIDSFKNKIFEIKEVYNRLKED